MSKSAFLASASMSGSLCDPAMLGRFGNELASMYDDTLQAPLPSRLQLVMDRLEAALRDASPNDGSEQHAPLA